MNVVTTIKSGAVVLVMGGLMGVSLPARADGMENLAKTLISMRGEVEELQSQLDMEKQSHKTRMDALSSQMADLSVENQRQTVAMEKLQQALVKYEQATAEAKSGEESLVPVVLAALGDLTQSVQGGLPFKIEERLSELSNLRAQVEARVLEPKKAANRIWAFIEDEIRLTRENGVYSQTIDLDGEKRLVDVAKLGTVFLYFQSSDNRFGQAVKQSGEWRFAELKGPKEKERISVLFDSLKQQIRQGYFELPNPWES
jgi:hypothetical protein